MFSLTKTTPDQRQRTKKAQRKFIDPLKASRVEIPFCA